MAWRADKSPYDLLWAQMLDWIIPKERNAPNRPTPSTCSPNGLPTCVGEKPEVRAVVQLASGVQPPASLPLRIRTPDDKVFDYVMRPATIQTRDGRSVRGFAAVVEPNVPGVFRAEAHADLGGGDKPGGELRFVVTRPATEITGKPINRDLLRQVADASKGHFYRLGAWDNWPRDLHVQEQHFSRLELDDLWNRPWLLAVLMSALAAEWIVRKMWHLP